MRIRMTWVAVGAMITLLLFTSNAWDKVAASIVAESLFVTGIALAGIVAIGPLWCSLYIAGRKNGILVVEGTYSLCRNPLYLFRFIGAVGFGLATETVTVPLVIAAVFAAFYP